MMPKKILTLNAMFLVVLITMWVGGWGSLASAGTREVKPQAPVPETGQTGCWDAGGIPIDCAGTGEDGEIQAGVPLPTPRFTDNQNGTVTDRLTGLIWLKDATCPALVGSTWAETLQAVRTLATSQCGLRDRSQAGAWRLPNVRELYSLIDYGFTNPSLSNAAGIGPWIEGDPFTHANGEFWTSTTYPLAPNYQFIVSTAGGVIFTIPKGGGGSVWPVRGGN